MSLAARKIRLVMQLRRAGISDTAVLAAVERIPREHFVPPSFRDQSYENRSLPIGYGRTLSQPQVVAEMTQALRPDRRTKVLEVGTGSGYQAAVLSQLCRRVYTIERHRPLLRAAERRFAELRLHNITARLGDGGRGWREQAPFQRIVVTAAVPRIPGALADQLGCGGIMVLPLGRPGCNQDLLRLTRDVDGRLREEALGRVRFVPLLTGAAEGCGRGHDATGAAGPESGCLA